jgi:DNA adenine methylase
MDELAPVAPPLKWAGGKRSLLQDLMALLPQEFGRYFEPFFGGGSLFFALAPARATLGDLNEDLISFYQQLASDWHGLIQTIAPLKNNLRTFKKVRSSEPTTAIQRAARLYFLNRTCYNGLYRTNRAGKFNVPFGNNGRAICPDVTQFKRCAALLKGVKLVTSDFEETCKSAKPGDFVFFDPPYTVAHENNGFVKYNAVLFTWDDQRRLARLVKDLTARRVKVLLTNAAHPSIRELYSFLQVRVISRSSLLAARADSRGVVHEFVLRNYTG